MHERTPLFTPPFFAILRGSKAFERPGTLTVRPARRFEHRRQPCNQRQRRTEQAVAPRESANTGTADAKFLSGCGLIGELSPAVWFLRIVVRRCRNCECPALVAGQYLVSTYIYSAG